MARKMYHTQEKWTNRLTAPIICKRADAWLGDGYYFWDLLLDARLWGHSSKKTTGEYEVYSADIDTSKVLDTVFNEEHYKFWLERIEKVAMRLQSKSSNKQKPTLRQVNNFLRQEGVWADAKLDGIMFQDNTADPGRVKIVNFEYKKRIQLAAFTERIISNFSFLEEKKCF